MRRRRIICRKVLTLFLVVSVLLVVTAFTVRRVGKTYRNLRFSVACAVAASGEYRAGAASTSDEVFSPRSSFEAD